MNEWCMSLRWCSLKQFHSIILIYFLVTTIFINNEKQWKCLKSMEVACCFISSSWWSFKDSKHPFASAIKWNCNADKSYSFYEHFFEFAFDFICVLSVESLRCNPLPLNLLMPFPRIFIFLSKASEIFEFNSSVEIRCLAKCIAVQAFLERHKRMFYLCRN